MIPLIALIPALGVVVVAAISDSRGKTTVAAIFAATVGVFTGSPTYIALVLVFVGVVYIASASQELARAPWRRWPQLACASCWISRRLWLGLAAMFVAVVALARCAKFTHTIYLPPFSRRALWQGYGGGR